MSTPSSIVGEQYRSWQLAVAEGVLALLAVLRGDLGGVLAGVQAGERAGRSPVEVAEERVDPRAVAAGVRCAQRVVRAALAVAGPPDQRAGLTR